LRYMLMPAMMMATSAVIMTPSRMTRRMKPGFLAAAAALLTDLDGLMRCASAATRSASASSASAAAIDAAACASGWPFELMLEESPDVHAMLEIHNRAAQISTAVAALRRGAWLCRTRRCAAMKWPSAAAAGAESTQRTNAHSFFVLSQQSLDVAICAPKCIMHQQGVCKSAKALYCRVYVCVVLCVMRSAFSGDFCHLEASHFLQLGFTVPEAICISPCGCAAQR